MLSNKICIFIITKKVTLVSTLGLQIFVILVSADSFTTHRKRGENVEGEISFYA